MQVVSERTVAEARNELVTVRKAVLDFGRENVAGIKLTVLSSVDRPVTVEVVEEFPGHFSMADVQVHPGYNPEKWSISKSSRRMVFEEELAPWGEVETVYGVRVDPDNLDPLLTDPTIAARAAGDEGDERPDPAGGTAPAGPEGRAHASGTADAGAEPSGDPASADPAPDGSEGPEGADTPDGTGADRPSDGDSTAESGAGNGPDPPETEPSTDGEPAAEAPADTAPTDRPSAGSFVYGEDRSGEDPTGPEDPTRTAASAPATEETTDGPFLAADDVVPAFVEAVSRGALSDDQRAAIRAGLDLEAERHQDVQFDHLQAAVAKHAAFADEFEAFVDAVGSPASAMEEMLAAIEGLERVQADLQARVDELSTAASGPADDRADVHDRLDAVSEAVRTGADERQALRDRVDELSNATRAGAEARDELRARMDDLTAEVRDLAAGREEVEARVDELASDARGAVEGREALESRLGTLAESVRTAAEDRAEFRDRLDEFATAMEAVGDARSELRQHLNELLHATRLVAENLDTLRDRFDRFERDLEGRREERVAGLERLDARVSELEGLFESDEAAAIREIFAAEQRWRQRREDLRSRGRVSGSPQPGDR